jgi:hypothetical protein
VRAQDQREQNSPSSRLRLRSSIRVNRPLRRFAVRWVSPRRHRWTGGFKPSKVKNWRRLEKENSRLRKVVAHITTHRPEPAPLRKRIARSPRGELRSPPQRADSRLARGIPLKLAMPSVVTPRLTPASILTTFGSAGAAGTRARLFLQNRARQMIEPALSQLCVGRFGGWRLN